MRCACRGALGELRPRDRRSLAPVRSLTAGLPILLLLSITAAFAQAQPRRAAPAIRAQQPVDAPQGTPDADDPRCGELRVVDASGKPAGMFPLRHTDVRGWVSGGVARVLVEQTFRNPYDRGIEAVYVFPLPHEAAVDDLQIRIGERIVRGEIHRRQEAREIYEQAKQQGRVAALLDQERPNIFTQSVANIQPGHEIVVRIRYVQTLKYEDGAYEMVFPTVVGPRYIPGAPLGQPVAPAGYRSGPGSDGKPDVSHGDLQLRPSAPAGPQSGAGWAQDTDQVPDASRITPPVVPPGTRSGHDIMIDVDVDAGVPLYDLQCTTHAVDIEKRGRGRAHVRLRPSDTLPNKDFVLRWRVAGGEPEFAVLAHRDVRARDGWGYFTLQLQPEAEVTEREARPKEMVFVLDTSGSMQGEPLGRSKAAMRWALQHLNPDDSFQIIRFSEAASQFAPGPIPNTPANVQRALVHVEQLQGEGGTEMLRGIEAALDFPPDPERLRIVCFLTDGYIGNEEEILSAVQRKLGGARLFSFGVGTSVNRYLLDELARAGRGAVDYVPLDGDTAPIVERFYARIAKPYLTDLDIDWGDLDVQDASPDLLPDLFANQPLVVAGRYRRGGTGDVVIRGRLGRQRFSRRLHVELPAREADHEELGTLWARRRIEDRMRQMVRGERDDLVREVTDLGLEFHLVTRYTSFVAVDNQVVSSDGKPMLVPQPVEMPEGVSYEGVFGTAAAAPGAPAARAMLQGAQMHIRGGRASEMATNGAVLSPPAPSVSGTVQTVTVTGMAKRVDVKASDVSHVTGDVEAVGGSAAVKPEAPKVGLEQDAAGEWSMPGGLVVRLEAERSTLSKGEPVRLRITVRNDGSEAVRIPARLDLRDGSLRLRVELAGRAVPAPVPSGVRYAATIQLRPRESHTFTVTLSGAAGYAFAVPGRYEIVLEGLGALVLQPPPRSSVEVKG